MIKINRFKCIDFFFIGIISFIWRRPEIVPENNGDANTGTVQHATDGPNVAKDDTGLLTTIRITQKQIGKLCLYAITIIVCIINCT